MGYNSTVVINNDALDQIAKDKDFGKKLAAAVSSIYRLDGRVDIPAGNHSNAAHVVESHHADETAVVTVGGNLGVLRAVVHGWTNTPETQKMLLDTWAAKLGYRLVKVNKVKDKVAPS